MCMGMRRLWLPLSVLVLCASTAAAQNTTSEPFAIKDNSFLVEEAFNQERGIVQNIFGLMRLGDDWDFTFTQEWPVNSVTHQLSYTTGWSGSNTGSGFADTLLNYRYQAMEEGAGKPALAPRASLILPTGRSSVGAGGGSPGLQVSLPFSKQDGDVYLHWNAGTTWLFRAPRRNDDGTTMGGDDRRSLVSPFVAGSAIYRVRPMFHLMLEAVLSSDANYGPEGVSHERAFTLSPGFRRGWNIARAQIVVGAALPTTWTPEATRHGVFGYFSYELPFTKKAASGAVGGK